MRVCLERTTAEERFSKIVRAGGYLILAGAFLGVTIGVYALLTPHLLFFLIDNISQYEATRFFLGVYLPSLAVIVTLGYMFATTPRTERFDFRRGTLLSVLGLLCIVLSALSPFNFLSFIGGLLALTAVILAYTKPAFKALWKREACFLVINGSLFVAAASTLFLLMWFISRLLPTYSAGFYGVTYSFVYMLVITETLSFACFLLVPVLCYRGSNVGLCAALGLAVSIVSSLVAFQNSQAYFNPSGYLGALMLVAGIAFTVGGTLVYIKLFLSEAAPPMRLVSSFSYGGKYCSYCGEPWTNPARIVCSSCGRSLKFRPEVPFCPYCGRLVPKSVRNCPHCQEDVWSRPIYHVLRKLEKKEEAWIVKKRSIIVQKVSELFSKYVDLSLKEFVYVIILTSLFIFFSFIGYVRAELHPTAPMFLLIHYGFPLEWLEVVTTLGYMRGANIFWGSLVIDFSFYFLIALAIVYGFKKLVEHIHE